MTATDKTFKWILWSHDGLNSAASDEFVSVAEGFRVRLMGNMLEMSFEAPGPCSLESAKSFAEKYVGALRKCGLMLLTLLTEAEWLERTTPPCVSMRTISINREDRSRIASAVREARNELFASKDGTLQRCYNYLQDAHEHMRKNIPGDESVHVAVYKAMEVLETHFRGEQKAGIVLGNAFKKAKTAANTERHIPEKVNQQQETAGRVIELATQVIRNYERHVLEEAYKKKDG